MSKELVGRIHSRKELNQETQLPVAQEEESLLANIWKLLQKSHEVPVEASSHLSSRAPTSSCPANMR